MREGCGKDWPGQAHLRVARGMAAHCDRKSFRRIFFSRQRPTRRTNLVSWRSHPKFCGNLVVSLLSIPWSLFVPFDFRSGVDTRKSKKLTRPQECKRPRTVPSNYDSIDILNHRSWGVDVCAVPSALEREIVARSKLFYGCQSAKTHVPENIVSSYIHRQKPTGCMKFRHFQISIIRKCKSWNFIRFLEWRLLCSR